MRILTVLQLWALATLTMTSTALAVTENGPVRVTSCVVLPRNPEADVMRSGVDLTNGVIVTLLNTSDKTTSAVTVTGSYHGRVVTDTADVFIKPGGTAEIMRRYTPSPYYDTDAKCNVIKVTFTDGTSWSLPASPGP